MKRFQKLMKKKKTMIFLLIIIILFFWFKGNQNKQSLPEENVKEMVAIEKRTIAKSVSATGTITTENSKEIVASLTGSKIASIPVKEGQKVKVGDVLCTFDMSSVQKDLSNAKTTSNLSDAQSNLGIEAARRNLEEAVKNRDLQIVNSQKEVATAQDAYTNAQTNLNALNEALAQKQTELETIGTHYTQTQNALNATPDDETLQKSLYLLEQQKESLNTEIAQLQVSVAEAQMSVNQLKSAFDTAVSTLASTSSAADNNVATMQDNLTSAELSAKSSSITQNGQLDTYEEQLEKGIVTSTIDGTVTSIEAKVGDLYTGTTIATINGIDELMVEAQIDEYDIADIKQGMKALIKTDATKEEELEGTVSYVAITPVTNTASATTGVVSNQATYKIKIALKEQNERLRLGMNAKISIILESKEDVWTVPFDAIHERENGTHYVEVLKDNNIEEIEELEVQIGTEGTYYVEIMAEKLKEGMQVVLPKQEAGTTLEDLIQMQGPSVGI